MPEYAIEEITRIVNGRLDGAPQKPVFRDYHFDSRQVTDHTLFFALSTPRNDGHRYLPDVARFRHTAAVVQQNAVVDDLGLPLIRVTDPEAAYLTLARHVRRSLDTVRYIGITGSAGKTTTKEFTYQILAHRFRAYRAPGNWNNWIGVPFALLKMDGATERAAFELAMSDPGRGEIEFLARLLQPHVAVVLNALPVHLEFLKTVANVARAKLEILQHLAETGVALVNGDNEWLHRFTAGHDRHVIYFGRETGVNRFVLQQVLRETDRTRLVIRDGAEEYDFVSDVHSDAHVENLFAAILAARFGGMTWSEIRQAVHTLAVPAGRGTIHRRGGLVAVDETYNSNPAALGKLLTWAAGAYSQTKVAVLGDMLELGDEEKTYHLDIGRLFSSLDYALLITVGRRAAWLADGARKAGYPADRIIRCESAQAAGEELQRLVQPGWIYIFKASRGIGLEKALRMLLESVDPATQIE
ncbi:MAG: UDP-N-acetylmuramoyl-tripeptide--D-alanyl-D-alanine ligase [Acidobacteria bacterium]|nr:UDP-N-acetylmuramoyl-tripeptide--D-alanyl-D-alanine ligase [Acidobacteriota bacterium]